MKNFFVKITLVSKGTVFFVSRKSFGPTHSLDFGQSCIFFSENCIFFSGPNFSILAMFFFFSPGKV